MRKCDRAKTSKRNKLSQNEKKPQQNKTISEKKPQWMQFRCTLLSSANVSSSPRFIDCGSALVLLDLHSFRCFRITRCTHHADSWSQLRSIAPESMHPPRASDTRNTLLRHSRDPAESLERRRASRGQKLIRPPDLISWAYSHHNPQHILHCVALTAALPWLYGTQLKGPAGVDLGPVWLFIYPRSIPRVWGQCLAVPRQLQKSLNAAVTRWRPLMCSSKVFLSCENISKYTWWGLFKAFQVESCSRAQGCKPSWSHCSTAPGGCVPWEPLLPAQHLSCHGLAGQACHQSEAQYI